MSKIFLVLSLLFSCFTLASSLAACDDVNDECIAVGEWDISLGLGYGEIANPLYGGDDITLVLLPSIRYYGEKLFFERTTLGYSFIENDTFALSAITQPNRENAFFSRWHANNIFVDSLRFESGNFTDQPETILVNQPINIDVSKVQKRRWALDAGIQLNWFLADNMQAQVKILHDVNHVYSGFNAQFAFSHQLVINPKTRLASSFGAYWLSANLTDYYYGIDWQDNLPSSVYHQGKSAFNPYLSVKMTYQFNANWQLTGRIYYERLDNNIQQSPLIDDDNVSSYYVALVYVF